MAEPWSVREVDRVVDAYFAMLGLELAHEDYSKTEFRRGLTTDVHRSDGSLEFKFQNVSAVLDELGAFWIPGYKPRRNVQQLLRERVTQRYENDADLRQDMLRAAEAPVAVDFHRPLDAIAVTPVVEPPMRSRRRVGRHVDFAAREAANRSLGLAGELAIVDFERRALAAAGRADLAEAVRHVSVVDGDGLGYDVLSFDATTEAERYIEVKTTRFAKELPFHVSRNEVEFSQEAGDAYSLARVYQFGSTTRGRPSGQFRLTGALSDTLWLEAQDYLAGPA